MGNGPISFGVHLEVKGMSLELHVRITDQALLEAVGDCACALSAEPIGGIDLQPLLDQAHHGLLEGADALALVVRQEACRALGLDCPGDDAGEPPTE